MTEASVVAARLRSGSWAAGVPRHAHDDCASIPGSFGWALRYVEPLPTWMTELEGDPAAVFAFATELEGVQRSVGEVALTLERSARALDTLNGRTVRALRERHHDVAVILDDVQDWSGATAAALHLASTLVTACHDAVCGLLSSLSRMAQALFGFTLNPFDKLDDLRRFADAAWDLVVLARDLIEALLTALGELARLIVALIPLIQAALGRLKDLLGRMLPGIAMLSGGPVAYLLGTGLGDMLRANPRVGEFDPRHSADPKAYSALMEGGTIRSPVDLLTRNGLVDKIGGGDSTAISVSTVRRPDGTTYTLVNLPSTQDWGALKGLFSKKWADTFTDAAPVNDLDSNIALMIMNNPVLRTQYERAVTEALSDAGVPAGSDVVWSGFSQGGIMAGNLAAESSLPYRTVGVVTNGAPIDGFPIPSNVPVMQVEHASDPVPKLDLRSPVEVTPHLRPTSFGPSVTYTGTVPDNVDWVVLPDPGGSKDAGATHNADNYSKDLQHFYDTGGRVKNDWSFLNGTVENVYVGTTKE